MKNNKKGFGALAIVLLLAGILVVGGGAYYVGTKNSLPPPPSENTGGDPVVLQNQNNTTNSPMVNTQSNCLPTTAPWIKIISPNGGETYTAGQNITVKWTSCNISPASILTIGYGRYGGYEGIEGVIVRTLNDGQELVSLEKLGTSSGTSVSGGYNFSIYIGNSDHTYDKNWVGDLTDSTFRIKSNTQTTQDCSKWLTFTGVYTVKYPSCWLASDIKGGSIGTADQAVGVLLKPSIDSLVMDSISIGGWQYDCNQVNVSGGNNPAVKAYCIKPESGHLWIGQYITALNQGSIYGVPVITRSTNSQVLEMFDQIVLHNL